VQVFAYLVSHPVIDEILGLVIVSKQPRSSPQDAVSMQELNVEFLIPVYVALLVVFIAGVHAEHLEWSKEHLVGVF